MASNTAVNRTAKDIKLGTHAKGTNGVFRAVLGLSSLRVRKVNFSFALTDQERSHNSPLADVFFPLTAHARPCDASKPSGSVNQRAGLHLLGAHNTL